MAAPRYRAVCRARHSRQLFTRSLVGLVVIASHPRPIGIRTIASSWLIVAGAVEIVRSLHIHGNAEPIPTDL